MADQQDVDLDSIIDRLLEVRGSRPGKQVQLLEAEIRYLCTKAREIFISQPILLELEAPIKVCSDSLLHRVCASIITNALPRSVVIYMDSITISYDCLNTEGSRPRLITSSSATTSIGESSRWRLYAYCWHTRSSTPKTFSFYVATMSVLQLTVYTDSTMNANEDTISNCGRRLQTALTVCLSQLSLMRKYSQCTEACLPTLTLWSRSVE